MRQKEILELGDEITEKEVDLSNQMFELLNGKKVIATRLLTQNLTELFIEFDDGTRVFVNNFRDATDVSVTGGS